MPYQNEHAARVRQPDEFEPDSFRRKNITDGVDIIIGKLLGGDGSMVAQSYRFDKTKFTPQEAKDWLKKNNVKYLSFEPAAENKEEIMENEVRVYENEVEVRQLEDGSEIITGYAVVFNSESVDLGGFIETISPTAFREADMTDVVGLYNHDYNYILGRIPTTLTLSVDERGLRYEIKPPDTSFAKDLIISIKRGDIRGSSFGFSISKDGDVWEKPKERGGLYKRMVNAVSKLWDVSPVVKPAYISTNTSVAKRSLGMMKDTEEREVTDKIQALDELQELERTRFLKKMDVDLTYHDDTQVIEKIDREQKRKVKKLLSQFDKDFKIIKPEDQLKQFDDDFKLNDNERE